MSINQSTDPLPLPIEIIFSCAICQATILEIYKPGEDNPGLREDNLDGDRPATKLWLTECGHLTCGKHLPGGGAPFHRANDVPRAPCPICSSEKHDQKEKALYGIRGCADGSFDTGIPKSWFDSPPIKLDGQGKGMDALRFHYLSLIRFGTSMLAKYRVSQASVAEHQKKVIETRETQKKLNDDVLGLRSRVTELEKCEKELRPWKEREPKIKYYLGAFQDITVENTKLKEQLAALGYAVPNRKYSYETEPSENNNPTPVSARDSQHRTAYLNEERQQEYGHAESKITGQHRDRQDTSSSRTLSGPPPLSAPQTNSGPLRNLHTLEAVQNDPIPSSKRKRQDDISQFDNGTYEEHRGDRRNSRDLMPPPPLPNGMSRGSITRNSDLRDALAHHSPRQKRMRLGEQLLDSDLAILEDGFWQPINRPTPNVGTQLNQEPSTLSQAFDQAQSRVNIGVPTNQPAQSYHKISPSGRHLQRENREHSSYKTAAPFSTSQNEPSLYRSTVPNINEYDTDLYGMSPTPRRALNHIDSNIINEGPGYSPYRERTRGFTPSKHVYSQLPHTPSPQRDNLQTFSRREPVTSPFFSRQGAIPYSGSSRLTLNPDPKSYRNSQSTSSPYKMPIPRPPSTERRALNRLSFVSQPEVNTGSLSPQRAFIPYGTRHSHAQATMSSHGSSRDDQGLFRRPEAVNYASSSYQRPQALDRRSPNKQPMMLRDIPVLTPTVPSVASSFHHSQRGIQHESNPGDHHLSRRYAGGSLGRSGASRPSREGTRSSRDFHLGDFLDAGTGDYETATNNGRNGSRRIVRR